VTHATTKSPSGAAHDDALSALLDTEHALLSRATLAAAEAKQLIDEATERARQAEEANAATMTRELAEFDAAHERAVRDELARVAAAARAEVDRFTSLSEARVGELAAMVAARVLGA